MCAGVGHASFFSQQRVISDGGFGFVELIWGGFGIETTRYSFIRDGATRWTNLI